MDKYSQGLRVLALCLAAACAAFAQSQGTIQGVVTDNTGAVIPGAEITVTNIETGFERVSPTNAVGFYSAPGLNPGLYKITCSAEGFAVSEVPEMRLEVAQTARMDFELTLGTVTEVVEVSAAATLLQSERTEVGQVIDSKRILEMPLNGRNYLQLAQFTTGVLPSRQFGKGTRQDGESGGEGSFLAVGMHAAQNVVLVDGADNSSRNSGGALGFQMQAVKPPVDAVAEFKVVTNNTSAEWGYRSGGKVLVTTKSGANDYHGSAYHFLRNDELDATNFFANRVGASKPTLRQNQFGGTFGGPVMKNKMFYFFSYQGTRIRLGRSFTSTVPSAAVLSGDFSAQPNPTREIFDPLTFDPDTRTRQAFPNFTIPASRFDPVSQKVLAIYPAPNAPGRENLPNNFFFSPSNKDDTDQYDMRWDWNVNDAHRTFIRYSFRDQDTFQNGPLPLPANGGTGQTVDLPGHNWAASLNSTFGPTIFNEARFGYTHFATVFNIPFTENLQSQFGILGAPGDTIDDGRDNGFALFQPGDGFAQLGPRAFWPNFNTLDAINLADNITMVKGNHTLKFGAEFRQTNIPRDPARFRRGRFTFNGTFTAEQPFSGASRGATGNGIADMMLGWASNERWGFPNGEETRVQYWGFFIQDDWKITPKLTLNLGVRYELFLPPRFPAAEDQTVSRFIGEINGRPFEEGEGLQVGSPGAFGEAEFLSLFVQPTDGDDCGCRLDKNNVAPRVGFAYRLTEKTVIRSGGGIYYGENDNAQGESGRFFTGAPLSNEFDAAQPRDFSSIFVKDGFAPVTREGLPRAGLNADISRDFLPQFFAYQWFFDIQRELPGDTLVTFGYQGTGGRQLFYNQNVNRPLTPDPTIRWQDRKIRPFFNNVNRKEAGLNSSYNALTIKAEKRFTKGLTFLSSFTWSHNLDYGDENLQQGNGSNLFTRDRRPDRGNASLDRRLAYVGSFVYELPFGAGKSWATSGPANWIFGGWQVGGIISLLDGTPDAHTINVNTTNVGGANRGNLVRNPNLPDSEKSIDRWFDTTAVVAGGLGVLDNAGRNLIVGPATKNFDFSLSRRFRLPWEGHVIQFRFESFNFTNTPTFGRPNRSFGTAAVGTINAADEPRRIQFGLKYMF